MPARTLWEWNVTTHPFEAQLRAAVAGGFAQLTIPARKHRDALAQGLTAKDMRRMAADSGIGLDFLDGMSSWAPIRFPPDADPFLRHALDFSPDHALKICADLGLKHIVAISGFNPGDLPLAQL